jgi:leader peptidase (prepilin peptidase)/N-methyltransferase
MPFSINLTMSVFFFISGMVIGSFLNVCIYRIPKNIPVSDGRSKCPSCSCVIKGYDNIPL